jgi:hypothetical protein
MSALKREGWQGFWRGREVGRKKEIEKNGSGNAMCCG